MSLKNQRASLQHLLDETNPVDAQAVYYAYYHGDDKTRLFTYPQEASRAQGYIALSRTGMDLFRPLLTMRIPEDDFQVGFELINSAVPTETPVIIFSPEVYEPLLRALFDIQSETFYRLLVLDWDRFEPIINVLIVQTTAPNGLPRFVIRSPAKDNQVTASAGLNWQTPQFAEIRIQTDPDQRRQGWGKSVLAAMVTHLQASGRTPLYLVEEHNDPSYQLATSVGFRDTGYRQILVQGTRNKAP